jgi:hypothetical protein
VLLETVETSVIIVSDGSQTPNNFRKCNDLAKTKGQEPQAVTERLKLKRNQAKSGGKCRLFINLEFSFHPYIEDKVMHVVSL